MPSAVHDAFGAQLSTCLWTFLTTVEHDAPPDAAAEAFHDVFALPSRVLANVGGSRRRDQRVRKCLAKLQVGELTAHKRKQEEDRRRRRQHDERKALAKAIHHEMCAGNLGKAARRIDAEPLAQVTPAVLAELHALHPQALPPTAPAHTSPENPLLISADTLRAVLRRLPRNSAAGPSGWTYEHLKAAVNGSVSAFDALLRFVQYAVEGRLPHIPRLMASRLVPLRKPNGGIRPIAVGEVLLRLASLCASTAAAEAGPALRPLQLGVGVPGGAQCVGQALQATILAQPEHVVLQLDWSNAFNCLSRQSMLEAVAERAPALLPFAEWSYGTPTALWVCDAPPDTPPVMSLSGVRQGDPCGPLLFALTLQGALEEAKDLHPDVVVLAYADDTFLQGPPEDVARAYRRLTALGAAMGLRVQARKCTVYSHIPGPAAEAAELLDLPEDCVRTDGFVAAGCPIGTEAFITAHVNEVAQKVLAKIDALMNLPVPTQDKLLLLRKSLQTQTHHLARCVPSHLLVPALHEVEERIVDAMFTILGRKREECPEAEQQMKLPPRMGGMGLHTLTAQGGLPCDAAFLSQAALTQRAVATGNPRINPFAGAMREVLEACAAQIRSETGEMSIEGWPAATEDLENHVNGILPHAQRKVSEALAASRAAALRECFDPEEFPHQEKPVAHSNQARLLSVADPTGSAWLDAMPTSVGLTLADDDVVSSARHRLGLWPLPVTARPVKCACGDPLTSANPDHVQVCSRLSGAMTLRHNLVQQAWRRIATANGISTSVEPSYRHLVAEAANPGVRGYGNKGDILFAFMQDLVVGDVSITHPGGENVVRRASWVAGHAAEVRAKWKHEHSGWKGAQFVPLVMETYGKMCGEAEEFLREMVNNAHSANSTAANAALRNARLRLSVALCKGNGVVFRRAAGNLVKVSGRDCHYGAPVPYIDDEE